MLMTRKRNILHIVMHGSAQVSHMILFLATHQFVIKKIIFVECIYTKLHFRARFAYRTLILFLSLKSGCCSAIRYH